MCYWGFFISYGFWPSTTPDNISLQVIVSIVMLGVFLIIQSAAVLNRFHTMVLPAFFFPMFGFSIVGLGFYNTAAVLKDLIFIFCLTLPFMLALVAKIELNVN